MLMLRFSRQSGGPVSGIIERIWELLTSILPFAHSRLDTTPSISSLIPLTPSNSFFNVASRACSASYFDSVLRWASEGLVLGFCGGLEVLEGDANRSSVSESERSSFPRSGVDILCTEHRKKWNVPNFWQNVRFIYI